MKIFQNKQEPKNNEVSTCITPNHMNSVRGDNES